MPQHGGPLIPFVSLQMATAEWFLWQNRGESLETLLTLVCFKHTLREASGLNQDAWR